MLVLIRHGVFGIFQMIKGFSYIQKPYRDSGKAFGVNSYSSHYQSIHNFIAYFDLSVKIKIYMNLIFIITPFIR